MKRRDFLRKAAGSGAAWGVLGTSGLAFAGVGIGSVTLLPWVQYAIEQSGWRTACTTMGLMVLIVLAHFDATRPVAVLLSADGRIPEQPNDS